MSDYEREVLARGPCATCGGPLPTMGGASQCLRDGKWFCKGECFDQHRWQGKCGIPDPAPSGLTAAQEIRLAITLKAMELAEKVTDPHEADDEDIADFVHVVTGLVTPLAAWVEHGDGMTREQLVAAMAERGIPEPPVACPDPALHDEPDVQRRRRVAEADCGQIIAWLGAAGEAPTDEDTCLSDWVIRIITESIERVDALERQRDAVLAYITDLKRHMADQGRDIPQGFDAIRAIYAEHGDERNGDE